MKVVNLSDFRKELPGRPAKITFFGSKYTNLEGVEASIKVTVHIENGDVLGILNVVREDGGILAEHDGRYFFLPWPCAAVEIHDL